MRTRIPSRTSAVAAAAVLAGTFVVVTGTPAQAVSQTYLQINICGNKSSCYNGADSAGVDIANSVINHSAVVVSLNEVCGNQLTAAKNSLSSRGYNYQSIWIENIPAGSSSLATACKGYGNGLLVKFQGAANPADFADRRWSTAGGEKRGQLCAHIVNPDYYHCVLHLSASNDDARRGDLDVFFPPVQNLINSGKHVVVAGDFNVGPSNTLLDRYYTNEYSPAGYGRFREVDGSCWTRPATEGGSTCNEPTFAAWNVTDKKLDYIFVSRPGFGVTGGDVTASTTSDHDPLVGYVGTAF